jgi:hypothetical protein
MSLDFATLCSLASIFLSLIVGFGWSNSPIGRNLEKKAETTVIELFTREAKADLVGMANLASPYRVKIKVADRVVSTDLSALDSQLSKS